MNPKRFEINGTREKGPYYRKYSQIRSYPLYILKCSHAKRFEIVWPFFTEQQPDLGHYSVLKSPHETKLRAFETFIECGLICESFG